MKVPFKPQWMKEHHDRYDEAIETIYDIESIEIGLADPPSGKPKHVFDFPDGLRLIVSKDQFPTHKKPVIHFSASVEPGYQLYRLIHRGKVGPNKFLRIVLERFRTLSLYKGDIIYTGFSDGGIPHWICEKVKNSLEIIEN